MSVYGTEIIDVSKQSFVVFEYVESAYTQLLIRTHILNLMCRFKTHWQKGDEHLRTLILDNLRVFEKDHLVRITADKVTVLPEGKPFIRNICMAFDLHLMRDKPDAKLYSMTV